MCISKLLRISGVFIDRDLSKGNVSGRPNSEPHSYIDIASSQLKIIVCFGTVAQ